MKVRILSLALLLSACQSTDLTASTPVSTPLTPAASLEAPAAQQGAAIAPTARLPRRIHLDRFDVAARDWVRDRR